MSSLLKRGAVLALSRVSNQAILLFSPLLLVRILDVEEYGQYREFILYATLLKAVLSFAVNPSLLYFLPKYPDKERRFVTQAALFLVALSVLGIAAIWLGRDLIRLYTSFDFVAALALYLFFFINLDFLEHYWLAKKQPHFVLFYATSRLIGRLVVVVLAAYYTRDALSIAYALAAFECFRFLLVMLLARRLLFAFEDMSWSACREQIAYFLPLGVSGIIIILNENLSRLFVSSLLGPAALSLYVIGGYALPLVRLVRGSVADVIFPEMVESKERSPQARLHLWRLSTLIYCLFLFPIGTVAIIYAETIVRVLFTDAYSAAAPLFAIFSVHLIRDCFDLTLPLRAIGRTRIFVGVGLAALAVNFVLLYPFYLWLGLVGPAVALVITRLFMTAVLSVAVMRFYRVGLRDLLPWDAVGKVGVGCIAGLPLLFAPGYLGITGAGELAMGGLLFGIGYVAVVYRYRTKELEFILTRMRPVLVRLVPGLRRS